MGSSFVLFDVSMEITLRQFRSTYVGQAVPMGTMASVTTGIATWTRKLMHERNSRGAVHT